MADYQQSVPLFDEADSITGYCPNAIEGARFLMITAARSDGLPTVGYNDGTKPAIGISAHSADAGSNVGIHHDPSIITQVECAAALTAGQSVTADAQGRAIVATGTARVLGSAYDDAASGSLAFIDRSAR